MIKILYDGYMVRDMYNNYHSYSTVGKAPEYVKGYFCLRDDDMETLNDFGKVKIRAVIGERLDEYDMLIYEGGDDLPLVQYRGCFTDRQGNETPFEIIKGENTYLQDNGNQLKIFFDDDAPQTNIENSIDLSTDDLGRKTKLQKQHAAIMDVIKQLGFNPMAIPDGKKPEIEFACMELDKSNKLLFDGSSSFENAWRKGKALFRMANHASFAKRNK